MANRVYLTADTAGYTPTTVKGGWTTPGTAISKLGVSPVGTAATVGTANATITANRFNYNRRFISDPFLVGGTITGNVSGVIGMFESNTNLNALPFIFAYVTVGDTDTSRGTVFQYTGAEVGTATATSGVAIASTAMTSTAVQAGDRLCIEVGYKCTASAATSYTGTLHYGGTTMVEDLAASGNPANNPSWLEFSGTAMDGLLSQKFATLMDDFDDNVIDTTTRWPNTYGPVFESGGYALIEQLAPIGGVDQYAGYYSNSNYSIQDSSIIVQITGYGAKGGATGQAWAALTIGSEVAGTSIEVFIDYFNDFFFFRDNVDFFEDTPPSLALIANTASVNWIRIKEAAGTTTWDTSVDGLTWTNRRTKTTHGWFRHGALAVTLQGYRDSGTADYTYFNNFNIAPVPFSPRSSAMMQFVMD